MGLKEWFDKLKTKNGYRVLAKADRAVITKLVEEALSKESVKAGGNIVIKTAGPESTSGSMRGHCYDGTGWVECDFWEHSAQDSRCMLFGGESGISKRDSESLLICDKIYGTNYNGKV